MNYGISVSQYPQCIFFSPVTPTKDLLYLHCFPGVSSTLQTSHSTTSNAIYSSCSQFHHCISYWIIWISLDATMCGSIHLYSLQQHFMLRPLPPFSLLFRVNNTRSLGVSFVVVCFSPFLITISRSHSFCSALDTITVFSFPFQNPTDN